MIDLFKVRMSEEASNEVSKVLQSGFIGQGPKVEEFEDFLLHELSTQTKPITVNSCTSAIDLALELCGVGPGDEVISTPQTCFASQVGVLHRKAWIRWADINPITGLIDPISVANLITKRTKVIIAVNWAGKFCNYDALKAFGVPVIEDAAHTWDSFLVKKPTRGDYVCYSLQAIKFLTAGDGGILICPNEEKEKEARLLRWFGLDRTKGQSFRCTQNITKAGFKYHMNDINAAIGISNIPLANNSVSCARINAKFLTDNIRHKNMILPCYDETHSFWLFSMHVLDGRKQEFIDYMTEKNIMVSPVHFRNDMYDCTKMFQEKELPGVESFDRTQVCIPNGWWLNQSQLDYIVDTVRAF